MNREISDNIKSILVCPNCAASLIFSKQGATCCSCQTNYMYSKSGALDLRLQQEKEVVCDFTIGSSTTQDIDFDFCILPEKRNPEVDFSNIDVPLRLTKEIMSHFPKAKKINDMMLDLGCGNTAHKQVCEHAGFEYIGLDYSSEEAPILGDAHALPFKNDCLKFILSIAALQQFKTPFVAVKEAYRVLQPKGLFIGTVSFLEPFNLSFYNYTHLGIYYILKEGGFNIVYICPSKKWSGLVAQAKMVLFPKMPNFLLKSIIMPIQILHKTWWRIASIFTKRAAEDIRIRNSTGMFAFICQK